MNTKAFSFSISGIIQSTISPFVKLLLSGILTLGFGSFAMPNSPPASQDQSNLLAPAARFDFDGDRKADLAVFRPSEGVWYILNSTTGGMGSLRFGTTGDVPVAADYDGDGKYDVAVYRGGTWYRLLTSNFTWNSVSFGLAADVPTSGDFDGDMRADVAVYRPTEGVWYYLRSSNSAFVSARFGMEGDVPSVGDYDGDGKADINLFRPNTGVWYRLRSSDNGFSAIPFGTTEDTTVVGDFDGDLKSDIAVWRGSTGVWYIHKSSTGTYIITQFGLPTDIPVPADYDGDGKTDIAVFRASNSTWHRINSGSGNYVVQAWGTTGDIAVAANRRNPQSLPTPTPTPVATPTPTPTPVTTPTPTPTPVATPTPTPTPTATPTATPTPTPTATPTPTPTPTPTTFTCDYYASPTGTVSGTGTITSPWDLQTALGKTTLIRSGKTLCLRGGTYVGKFRTTLAGGGIVRSAPGEWAKIDGYKTTTLVNAINTTQTAFAVVDASGVLVGGADELVIGGEVIKVFSKSGNQITDSLRGASNSLNGPEPHVAASVAVVGGDTFYIAGTGMTYRDFEVMNSRPSRDGNTENQGVGRGNGVTVVADGNKLVNLVIHDNLSGVFTSSASSNTEVYGCLIFNNGMHSRSGGTVEEPLGHGMYLENSVGFSKIYEDIVFNNFNLGAQAYGVTAPYVGGDIAGTMFANSGSPMGKFGDIAVRNYNLIIGPDSQMSPTATLRNSYTYHPATTIGYSVKFGYGAGVGIGTITNNFFVGGGTLFEIANTPTATITGNQFYSSRSGAVYSITPTGQQYVWNNNTYHGGANRDVFGIASNGLYQLPTWRNLTGFDANSSATGVPMPDTAIVRPNSYQPGRANIVIYSFSGASAINVNLSSSGLVNGQRYTIRNVQNYFGPSVITGTYNSATPTIAVPLNGAALTVASPIGFGFTPATMCPQFCPMVIVPD